MADLESTVWMIHAGTSKDGVKGRLALEPLGVVFRPAQARPGAETVFPLGTIRRAHRTMGTPVLELSLQPNAGPGPLAKRVSSPPLPTPSPGWILVPRCRTMIEPAVTS